jgi:hypothetical protein
MAAWQDARRLVSANADVLMAIAGVFFLLPLLALAVFVDPPAVTAQMTQAQLAQSMQDYYLRNARSSCRCRWSRSWASSPCWCACSIAPPTVGEALRNCARACRPISPRRSWSACLPPC